MVDEFQLPDARNLPAGLVEWIGGLRGELKYGQSFLDSRTIGLLVHYISLPREEFMNLYRQGSQHPDGDLLLGIYHYLKYLENKH